MLGRWDSPKIKDRGTKFTTEIIKTSQRGSAQRWVPRVLFEAALAHAVEALHHVLHALVDVTLVQDGAEALENTMHTL
jgi:hypothetical protein